MDKKFDAKKILKDALKNEVNPLLIGLRNDIKAGNKELSKIFTDASLELVENLSSKMVLVRGKDGHNPELGKDYFTEEDKLEIQKAATPVYGKDYFTLDEQTAWFLELLPVKGVDYFDGATPQKGVDYFTDAEIKKFLSQATPIKGTHYFDGKTPIRGVDYMTKEDIKLLKGKDAPAMSAVEIRDKLESLRGSARFDAKYIKNLPSGQTSTGGGFAGSNQLTLSLTTIGTSGAATYNPLTGVLNIPQYSGGGGAGLSSFTSPNSTITIGGSLTDPTIDLPAMTAGSVMFAGASGFPAQDNANLFWDDTNNRLGIGTTVPTHPLTFPISSTGIVLYNVGDGSGTYERLRMAWAANVFAITGERSGGSDRVINVTSAGATLAINGGGSSIARSTGSSAITVFAVNSTMTNTAGISGGLAINGIYSGQSLTAGWTALLINPTDTGGGGGAKHLIIGQLGGVDKFKIDSTGSVTVGIWTSTKIGLAYGGTNADLSATGGAANYLKQASSGAAITVGTIPASDIASGAALTKTDDTNVTLTLGGTPATALLAAASLTLGWTGTLSAARGGTGQSSLAAVSHSAWGAPTADISWGSFKITNLLDPTSAQDAATKNYVDNAVLGQQFKEAAKYATTAALPTVVYANGSSGVGATLTGAGVGALSLDSQTPSVGDRVLVKNQVSTFQNGIYTVTAVGSGIAVFVMTRATDFDQAADIRTGDSLFVTSGTTQSATTWANTGIDAPVMGTDAITFVQVAGQGSFLAGTGIGISGTTISIDTSVTVDKTTAQTLTNKTLTTPIIAQISNTGTLTLPTSSDTLVGRATTDTLTNKRITVREVSMADATSFTPTGDTADDNTQANTQATGTLTANAPSGTPTAGQKLFIRIKSTNVQTFAWNAIYRGSTDLALPATSTGGTKTDYLGFKYNSADSKWDLVSKVFGFT